MFPRNAPARGMSDQDVDVTGTRSLEMPQALRSLFEMQSPMQPGPGPQQQPGGMESRLGIGADQFGATGGMGAGLPSYQEGGMIGPGGVPVDFGNPYAYAAQQGMQPAGTQSVSARPGMDQLRDPLSVQALNQSARGSNLFTYQEGGMVGQGGAPVPPGMAPTGMPPMGEPMGVGVSQQMDAQAPMDPQMLEMNLNQFVTQNPQQMQEIRAAIMQELQSGELTAQELNQVVQLATVAAQNPEMYSNIRNFVIQQGIATDADLPQQYDQGLVFAILLAGRSVQEQAAQQGLPAGAPTGGAPTMQPGMTPDMGMGMGMPPMGGEPVIPSMAMGGPVGSSGNSKPVVIEAHTGEYVIPKNVVEMKGKEFFDSLVEKYRGGN